MWFWHLLLEETLYTPESWYPAIYSFNYGWLAYEPDDENPGLG